ncbi:hypothetical protein [Endozoicomonas sp. 8E]|uniref:hypothetical protein n=1 Tax=Endozoicomonas sp. 8E TaxID=3035692 RepID=UPI00293952A4|nr:hypothetical protein [Endozoicomonas sp. 8E]WOG28800.1 hypothetical protein P6910_03840 [Endozoicomonas sp. 8E]
MVDSVNRNSAVVVPTQAEVLKEIEKTNPVSSGFDNSNTISVINGEVQVDWPIGASKAPSIPEPDSAITGEVGNLEKQVTQQTAARLRGEIGGIFGETPNSVSNNRPELANLPVNEPLHHIDNKLSTMVQAPPHVLQDIDNAVDQLRTEHVEGTLTADKLEEILAQINASLEDSSVKYAENKIEMASLDAQQRHDSNIERIREHIEEANSASAEATANPDNIFLKALSFLFPPVMLWETALMIDREVNPGKDNSHLSIFSKNEIDFMLQQTGDADVSLIKHASPFMPASMVEIGSSEQTDNHPSKTDDTEERNEVFDESGSPVSDATEGLQIASEGLDHFERRKALLQTLQQQAESEEAKKKLEAAINALEGGDPALAEEILGSQGLDSSIGDSMSAATGDKEITETKDIKRFIGHISDVPNEVLSSMKDADAELSLIKRFTSV